MLEQRNMGDSSACVMQPFCYASGFPNEANNKRNPNNADGGESVSFGRFMTESVAWEKWSTFSSSQNRYVEEAERISRPGSVAQKKAFFEAHYKKLAAQKAAAALQEQANSTSQAHQELEAQVGNTSKLPVNEKYERTTNIEYNKVNGAQPEKEMKNQLEDVDKKGSNFDKEVLHSMARKKAPISSMDVGTSKFFSTDTDNIATPNPMKNSNSSKRKKSLHMSLKFVFIRVMRKLETIQVGDGSSTASMDSWTPLTSKTKASMNQLQKHPSFTTLSERNRNSMTAQIISSPFGLRTEERDATGKKKHGKKINANEAQKRKLHIKLKEKAVIKIRKLRQCFCYKARPLSEFDNEIQVSKNGNSLALLLNSNPTMISTTNGNTSSNIQHGNQNGSITG